MTPLENMARANWERRHKDWPKSPCWAGWDGLPYDFKALNIEAMRAALSALIPPSEEMVSAMEAELMCFDGTQVWVGVRSAFTAAIQSILNGGEEQ